MIKPFILISRKLRYGKSKWGKYLVIKLRFIAQKQIKKNKSKIEAFSPAWVRIKDAGYLKLDPSDFIDYELYTTGDFEPTLKRLFKALLKPHYNAIDIGANIGYFTLVLANLLPQGKVFAFEPTPNMYQKLQQNLEKNKIGNVQLFKNAVLDQNRPIEINIPTQKIKNSGRASIRNIEQIATKTHVDGICIDSLLDKFSKIDFIKIDIEGAEHLALKGMQNLINRDKPFIAFELTDNFLKQLGSSSEKILLFLQELNYTLYEINEEELSAIHDIKKKYEQINVLAVPNTRITYFDDNRNKFRKK